MSLAGDRVTDSMNPYRPPESQPIKTNPDPADFSRVPAFQWSTGARVTLVLLILTCTAYFTFVLALLASTRSDQQGGMLFCGNVPVLLSWLVMVVRKNRWSHYCGVVATLVQSIILTAMLQREIGDAQLVIKINSAIGFVFVVLTLLCYFNITRVIPRIHAPTVS